MRARDRGRWGTCDLCVSSNPYLYFELTIPRLSPCIVICEQPQASDYQEGLKKQQLVFEFDIKTWEVGHPVLP